MTRGSAAEFPEASCVVKGCRGPSTPPDLHFDCSKQVCFLGNNKEARTHVQAHEFCECPRHCSAIMRNQGTTLAGCQSQHLQIGEKPQSCGRSRLKINSWVPAKNPHDDIFVEVGVCLEADLHGFSCCLISSTFVAASSLVYRLGLTCRAWARSVSNSRSLCRR